MNLQYISDNSGKTTGVFIPITDWNDLKKKFAGIEQQQINLPDWQIKQVRNRMEQHKLNPDNALDFDSTIEQIEKEL